jgi:hypothetical protein
MLFLQIHVHRDGFERFLELRASVHRKKSKEQQSYRQKLQVTRDHPVCSIPVRMN